MNRRSFVLILGYLAARLPNLMALPPATDEINFCRWAQLIAKDPRNLYVSFEIYNKEPLYTWFLFLPVKAGLDPVLSGRLLSVLFGIATLLLSVKLAEKAGGAAAAWGAGILAVLCPYLAFHERIGLYESLITAEAVAIMWLSYRLNDKPTSRNALYLGMALGAAFLTKSYTYVMAAYPFFSLLVATEDGRSNLPKRFLRAVQACVIAAGILIAGEMYPLLVWHKGLFMGFFVFIGQEPNEAMNAAAQIQGNFSKIPLFFPTYFGWPVTAVFLAAFGLSLVKRTRPILPLIAAVALPTAVLLLASRISFSRYLVHAAPFVLIASSWLIVQAVGSVKPGLEARKAALASAAIAFAVSAPNISFLYQLAADPVRASLTSEDHKQYVTAWSSGYGAKELNRFLESYLAEGPLDLFLAPYSGTPQDTIRVRFGDDSRLRIHLCPWLQEKPILDFGDNGIDMQKELYAAREGTEHLSIVNLSSRVAAVFSIPPVSMKGFLENNPGAKILWSYERPERKSALVFIQLDKNGAGAAPAAL